MVVVAGHSGRFVSDNRLDDVERHSRVCGHGNEGVAEAVERRLRHLVLATLHGDAHHDTSVLENLVYAVVNPAHAVRPGCGFLAYYGKHVASPLFYGDLH